MKGYANKIKFGVGILLLIVLLYMVNVREVLEVFSSARLDYLLLSVVLFVVLLASLTFRLHLLVKDLSVSFCETFKVILISYFFNSFLPSGIGGDGYKVIYLKNKSDSWTSIITYVSIDRIMGLAVIIVAGIAYVLYYGIPPGIWSGDHSFVVNDHLMTVLIGAVVIFSILIFSLWRLRHFRTRILEYFRKVYSDIVNLSPRVYLALLLVSLFTHFVRILRFYVYALCFSSDIAMMNFVFVLFAMQIVIVLPVSIGGLGVQEGIIAVCLSFFGVPLSVGVAIGLLNRGILWMTSLVGGIIFLYNLNQEKFD